MKSDTTRCSRKTTTHCWCLWRDGRRELPHAPKVALARDLVALIAERYAERKASPRLASVSA